MKSLNTASSVFAAIATWISLATVSAAATVAIRASFQQPSQASAAPTVSVAYRTGSGHRTFA